MQQGVKIAGGVDYLLAGGTVVAPVAFPSVPLTCIRGCASGESKKISANPHQEKIGPVPTALYSAAVYRRTPTAHCPMQCGSV